MTTLTAEQIAGYAKGAGFRDDALVKAVAIALAESSGDPRAYNGAGLDRSYGLWQINMIGRMGPARRKRFGLSSNSELFNPAVNAKAAYAISDGGKNFRPWTTFGGPRYRSHLPTARKAAGNPDTTGGTANATQAGFVEGLSDIAGFFALLGNTDTWIRLGMGIAGAVLLLFALAGFSGTSGRVKDLAGIAANVLPQGKALKAAGKVA